MKTFLAVFIIIIFQLAGSNLAIDCLAPGNSVSSEKALKRYVEQADLVIVGTLLDLNRKMTSFELSGEAVENSDQQIAFGREGRVLIRRVFKGQRFLSARFNELSTTARIQARIPTIILGSDAEGILQVRGNTFRPYEEDQEPTPETSLTKALRRSGASQTSTNNNGIIDEFAAYLREGMLNVHGFHSPAICNSAAERFDTRIFLLKMLPEKLPPGKKPIASNTNNNNKPNTFRWRILTAPISLNWRTIESIENALSKFKPQTTRMPPQGFLNNGKSQKLTQVFTTQQTRVTTTPVWYYGITSSPSTPSTVTVSKTVVPVKTTVFTTTKRPVITCADFRCNGPGEICTMVQSLPKCTCPTSCPDRIEPDSSGALVIDPPTIVCGNDGKTYESMCHLAKAQCETKSRTLRLKHTGSCDVPDPCLATNCTYGAICERSLDGLTSRCICPRQCPPSAATTVCGTDGRDYASTCQLRKIACETMRDVRPARLGKCNPCEGFQCPIRNQKCIVEPNSHQPRCVCVDTCSNLPYAPVCGTNGKTFSNICYLHLEACRLNMTLALFQSDVTSCRQTGITCLESTCTGPGEECIVSGRNGKPTCVCPFTEAASFGKYLNKQRRHNRRSLISSDSIVAPPSFCPETGDQICGEDNVTYASDCELRRTSCLRRRSVEIRFYGSCDDMLLCAPIRCHFGAKCAIYRQQAQPQQLNGEQPVELPVEISAKLLSASPVVTCRCPESQCSYNYAPVCGSDGKTYINKCVMEAASCRLQTSITVFHRGQCGGCEDLTCPFYANCTIDPNDGQPQCVCPTNCPKAEAVVCGSDNRTYINYCEMTVAACRLNMNISVLHVGYCDQCKSIVCPPNRICVYGRCVCPSSCVDIEAPVCGSDGRTYRTECHLNAASCETGLNLTLVSKGPCLAAEGVLIKKQPPSTTAYIEPACSPLNCRYGGNCELDITDGRVKCLCSNFTCLEIRDPVCASDGKLYGNLCELHKVACQLQKMLAKVPLSECQNLEPLPCNGRHAPLTDAFGVEYDCLESPYSTSSSNCPAKSFCHRGPTFAVCCPEGASSVKTLCETTDYGCCRDGASVAHGPQGEGCPEWCRCDPIGSFGSLCSLPTGQCMCRPGVTGLKCDQCARGFHSLSPNNHPRGCIPCDCDVRGTETNATHDCNSVTGQCLCRSNAAGRRCSRCVAIGQVLTNDGRCVAPSAALSDDDGPSNDLVTTCNGVVCQFGAVCARSQITGVETCSCEALQCSNQLRPVCASDSRSYANKCHMRLSGCRSGRRLFVLSFGYCPDSDQKATFADDTIGGPIDDNVGDDSFTLPMIVPSGGNGPLTQCDQRLNFRCLHGGTCYIDDNNNARCLCPIGRTGNYCEMADQSGDTTITPETYFYTSSSTSFQTSPSQSSEFLASTVAFPDSRYFVPSFSPRSYIKLKRPRDVSTNLTIELEVRAVKPSGTVLYIGQGDTSGSKQAGRVGLMPQADYVAIVLRDGFVEFRFDVGAGMMTIRSGRAVTLRQFHVVTVHWSTVEGSAFLQLDDTKWQVATTNTPISRKNSAEKAENNTLVLSLPVVLGYVKGADQRSSSLNERFGGLRNGFVGCIQSLRIVNSAGHTKIYSLVSTSKDVLFGRDIDECGRTAPCVDSPCLNRGTCVATNNKTSTSGFFCACPPGYSGSRCEITSKCDATRCRNGGTCQLVAGSYPICACPPYFTGPHCQIDKGNLTFIPMLTGRSFIERPPIGELAIQFRIEIWFLATQSNGVLFLAASQRYGRGDFVTINMADGYVHAHVRHSSWAQQILSEERIPLNVWTKLVVLRQKRDELILSINGRRSRTQLGRFMAGNGKNGNGDENNGGVGGGFSVKTKQAAKSLAFLRTRQQNQRIRGLVSTNLVAVAPASDQAGMLPTTPLKLPLPYFIGGFRHFYDVPAESNVLHHFEGSIQKVSIDDVDVTDILAGSLAIGGEIRPFAGPPCSGNPCLNRGHCQPQLADFRCACPASKVGDLCELDRRELASLLEQGGADALAVRFNGSTILRFYNAIKRRERQQETNKLRLRMRTLSRDGTLALIRKSTTASSDFLIVALRDGYVEVAVNLGSGQPPTALKSNRRVNDGAWHTVFMNRQRRLISLLVDSEPDITVFAPDGTSQLNSNGYLVIGGMDSRVKGLPIAYTSPFIGCMTGLQVDDAELELYSGRRGSARFPLSLCSATGDDQLQLRNTNS